MVWVEQCPDNLALFFLWMYGPAGAGKTAIAQTIAELCAEANLLAASFFFSRTAAGRNDNSRLVATLTWQLIQSIPEIREHVLTLLERDPSIVSRAPATQMRTLIIDPLNMIPKEVLNQRPRFIIIDGLDECSDEQLQRRFLNIIGKATADARFPLRFLITGRPESHIQDAFHRFQSQVLRIDLAKTHGWYRDIEKYLKEEFTRIASEQQLDSSAWPGEQIIHDLVTKSCGQFVYVTTILRFVGDEYNSAVSQLEIVLGLKPIIGFFRVES